MEAYVNEGMSLAQKLRDMQHPVDDEFLGVILLSGLTPEYDPMVMAIENCVESITSDFVEAKLLQDDKYNKENHEVALLSNKKTWKKEENKKSNERKSKYQKDKKDHSKSEKALQTSVTNNSVQYSQKWYIGSGTTTHMTFERDCLEDFENLIDSKIVVANNQRISGAGIGNAPVHTKSGIKTISEIVYVPELRANLLSVSKMVEKGHAVVFNEDKCVIYDNEKFHVKGEVVATATMNGGLYELDVLEQQSLLTVANPNSEELWRRRLTQSS
ncbi:uncharacterized protein LOC116181936 [Photinus pyralis]|uniref:uncharacterized protein LOC116181936 n=1 Tax=Photinus pyralis TaxID=7054 RepID=UPI00126755DA|nr:uncharacterized protein LOC116181936 [Photinus pyralis]